MAPPQLVKVSGRIERPVDGGRVDWVAAAPPDVRASFSGSALPFANPMQAFDNTPNRGTTTASPVAGGQSVFQVELLQPNSFYMGLGTELIEPSLYVRYKSNGKVVSDRVRIGAPVAYRTLTYPEERTGPEFYRMASEVDARTQEEILNDSEYTLMQAPGFWGTKPPL